MKNWHSWFQHSFINCYRWLTELLYHQFAWAYDFVSWFVSWGQWSKWGLDALAHLPDGEILEIGFGTGALLIEMVKRGRSVIGLEPSTQMQQVTTRKLQRESLSVNRVQGCAQALPFPNQSFAAIVATFPANYIADEASLREFNRVLKDEGRLVIVGINIQFSSPLKGFISNWFLGSDDQRLIQYLAEKVRKVGFTEKMIEHQHEDSHQTVMILRRING